MLFNDKLTLDSSTRITRDGYLVGVAKVAKAGIQEYHPSELGKPGDKLLRIYRPADEVFSQDALNTFAHRPVTDDHPSEQVTAANWAKYAKGYTGGEVARDGDMVAVPLTLMDAEAVKAQQSGKRELSAGYEADIEWTPGVTDSGDHYDGVQRNIRNNHIALVDAARAGHAARIGDSGGQQQPNNTNGDYPMDTVKMVVDGMTIETTEQGKQAIEKVSKQLADSQSELQKITDANGKEMATKDAEIDKLKKQVMDAEQLDKAVMERADLIDTARKIADVDYTGKSLADIRTMAVKAKLGDEAIKGDAYVEARFDILADEAKKSAEEPEAKHDFGDGKLDAYTAWLHNVKKEA